MIKRLFKYHLTGILHLLLELPVCLYWTGWSAGTKFNAINTPQAAISGLPSKTSSSLSPSSDYIGFIAAHTKTGFSL